MHYSAEPSLVQVMAYSLSGPKPLLNPWELFQWSLNHDMMILIPENGFAKCCQLTQNDSNIADTSFNKIFLNEHIKIYMVSSELCSVGIHQWSIDIGIVNGMALNRYQAIIYTSSLVIFNVYIDGLTQDCSNSTALAMESLQSCAEPLGICASLHRWSKMGDFISINLWYLFL